MNQDYISDAELTLEEVELWEEFRSQLRSWAEKPDYIDGEIQILWQRTLCTLCLLNGHGERL